jgi:hypothetical protein
VGFGSRGLRRLRLAEAQFRCLNQGTVLQPQFKLPRRLRLAVFFPAPGEGRASWAAVGMNTKHHDKHWQSSRHRHGKKVPVGIVVWKA